MKEVDATPKYPMSKAMQENCITQLVDLQDRLAKALLDLAEVTKERNVALEMCDAMGGTEKALQLAKAKKIAAAKKAKEDAENILKELE